MKRIGLFGGTFDPPTKAHLTIAEAACKNLSLDQFYFIPANQNPHKRDLVGTPADLRLKMLDAVLAGHENFLIEKCELERKGLSYTFDTLTYLTKKHEDAELFFIQGADSLISFPKWYKAEKLLELAQFVFFARVGWKFGDADKNLLEKVILFDQPELEMSSTAVRELVRQGKSIIDFVEEPVIKIISDNRLYLSR